MTRDMATMVETGLPWPWGTAVDASVQFWVFALWIVLGCGIFAYLTVDWARECLRERRGEHTKWKGPPVSGASPWMDDG